MLDAVYSSLRKLFSQRSEDSVLLADEKERTDRVVLPVQRTLCWGTHEEAERLGVPGMGTRHWAYRWIEEHVKVLAPVGVIVDLGGGGIDSHLPNVLKLYARQVIVVDRLPSSPRGRDNVEALATDLERDPIDLPSDSVDIVVSASAIEHLTQEGQKRALLEAQRILRSGGAFIGSISYVTGLTANTLALIARDPAFCEVGSPLFCMLNVRSLLEEANLLHMPYPPLWPSLIPGFSRFSEHDLLSNPALIHDFIGSYGEVKCLPEVDELRLKWFELGLYLQKRN